MGNIPSVVSGQLATAAQYNALQSGLNPLVENEYTNWKLITNVTTTATAIAQFAASIIVDEPNGVIYIYDYGNDWIWSMNIDGSGLGVLIGNNATEFDYAWLGNSQLAYYPGAGRPYTLTAKYIVVTTDANGTGAANNSIAMLSNGKVLQIIDVSSYFYSTASSGSNFYAVLSPTGRYLVVIGKATGASNLMAILVYEGQP